MEKFPQLTVACNVTYSMCQPVQVFLVFQFDEEVENIDCLFLIDLRQCCMTGRHSCHQRSSDIL